MFGCDNNKAVRDFAKGNFDIEQWHDDVYEPSFMDVPHVDVLDFGAPCQGFSRNNTCGEVKGVDDERSLIVSRSSRPSVRAIRSMWSASK